MGWGPAAPEGKVEASLGILPAMGVTDDLLHNAERWASTFDQAGLRVEPSLRLAVVGCMDSRLNLQELLGLGAGQAHFMRNAGGTVTDDVIRSLVISQRFLKTREIILIHHTDCGMLRFTDDELLRTLHTECGIRPTWAVETFVDTEEDLRMSMRRVRTSPFIPFKDALRGFMYDVDTGELREVFA